MEVSSLKDNAAGISQRNRALLEQLHRSTTGAFDVAEASRVLGMGHEETGRLLVYLARRGWLSRVRRGLYVAVPLDARRSGEWVEDPWVVAERIFSPCYIGGWSACAHWDLTEQVFRTVLVVTARRVRHRDVEIQGLPFHLTVRAPTRCSAPCRYGVGRPASASRIRHVPSWTFSTTHGLAVASGPWPTC